MCGPNRTAGIGRISGFLGSVDQVEWQMRSRAHASDQDEVLPIEYPEFAGSNVLVSGAGTGIGRAVARAFCHQGAKVVGVDLDPEGLSETGSLVAGNGRFHPIQADVADPQEVIQAHEGAVAKFGDVSILVNNVGWSKRTAFADLDIDDWTHSLNVNLNHAFQFSRLCAPAMTAANCGIVVNMSSHAWMKLAGDLSAYHAAKAGLVGLTRGMARDLGARGVRVNAVAPGRVVTEHVADTVVTDAWIAETLRQQCLPSLITPADIANTVLWLSSDQSRAVTGQTIIVDGGTV